MDEKKLIKEIKSAVIQTEQPSMFSTPVALEEACTAYLKHKGFTVIKPDKFTGSKVREMKDLISLFYSRLDKRINNDPKIGARRAYRNTMAQDLSIAKRFVESRMEVNEVGKQAALIECANIINAVFDNYEEFNFKYDISFAIFGLGKMAWVTEKAVQILNKQFKEKNEAHAEALRQAAMDAQDKSKLGFSDLSEILKRLEEEEN
jgi:hypothetical protein